MYLLALLRLSLRKIRKKGKKEEKMVAIAGNGVAASGADAKGAEDAGFISYRLKGSQGG